MSNRLLLFFQVPMKSSSVLEKKTFISMTQMITLQGLTGKMSNKISKMKMLKKERGRWRHFLPSEVFIFDVFPVNRDHYSSIRFL